MLHYRYSARMEIPGPTLITVRSSSNSPNDADGIFSQSHSEAAVTPTGLILSNPSMQSQHGSAPIANVNTRSLESHMLEEIEEMDMEEGTNSDSSQGKESHDIVVVNSPTQVPGSARGDHSNCCGHGLHSVSTTVVADEEARVDSFEDEVSIALEWFRSTFNKIGKNGRISLSDFKQAATECDVRTCIKVLCID